METAFRVLLLTLQLGVVFALIASGLTLIFGMMDVVNFAHGSFYMIGAYVAFSAIAATGNFWIGLLVAPVAVAIVGMIAERIVLRPLYGGDPLFHILATFAFIVITQGLVIFIWGTRSRRIDPPEIISGSTDLIITTYPTYRLFMLVFGTVILAGVWFLLSRTSIGMLMKACKDDAEMVRAMGIDVPRLYTGVFGFGVALAGLAGLMLGADRSIHAGMDMDVVITAFAIVVIGGLGSYSGAILGAMVIGAVTALAPFVWAEATELFIFTAMAAVLVVRPEGIMGVE